MKEGARDGDRLARPRRLTVTEAFAFKLARRPVRPAGSRSPSFFFPSPRRRHGLLVPLSPFSPSLVGNSRSREPCTVLFSRLQGTPVRIWPPSGSCSSPGREYFAPRVAVVLVLAVVVVDEASSASEHTSARIRTRTPHTFTIRVSRTSRVAPATPDVFRYLARPLGRPFGSLSCRDTPPVSVIDNGKTTSANSRPARADCRDICRREVAGPISAEITGRDICCANGKNATQSASDKIV